MFDRSHPEYQCVPARLLDGLDYWAVHGRLPGGLLQAVLNNDLCGAVNRMHVTIRRYDVLRGLVLYVWNELPAPCHGSFDTVAEWQEQRKADGPWHGAPDHLKEI